jgi:hypothetical protein
MLLLGMTGSTLLPACAARRAPGTWPVAAATQPAGDDEPVFGTAKFRGYSFDLFGPTEGAIEVAPGLFVEVLFGAWNPAKGEKPPGKRLDVIPLGSDVEFGFIVLFFPAKEFRTGEVNYRETLTLPAKPSAWPEPEEDLPAPVRQRMRISNDGRTCTTEQTITLRPGQMIPNHQEGDNIWLLYPFPTHSWGVAEGDPAGAWRFEAFVNDKLVGRATVQVTAPNAATPAPPASSRATTNPQRGGAVRTEGK